MNTKRAIHFRGFSKDGDGWVYGDLVREYRDDDRFLSSDPTIPYMIHDRQKNIYTEVCRDTIGQYIHYNDFYGCPIYEDDIITRTGSDNPKVVEWGFVGWSPFEEDGIKPWRVIVIGNIHEDSGFLE